MNVVVLVGRMARDPEIRIVNDKTVCNFVLAVDNPYKKDDASFINCQVWGKTAEAVGNYLSKGSQAAVSGRIQVRNYENKEGKRVYVTEVVADGVRFLDKKDA